MIVTKIQAFNKKKSRVYLDEVFAFVLYNGEMRRYGIREGEELTKEAYEEIVKEVLYKRGKSRALHLLASMERTEEQVKRKLESDGYPQAVIEQVIDFVKEYRYLDDERFASTYVRGSQKFKSNALMKAELIRKGVSSSVVQSVFEEEEVQDDEAAIRYWIEKKHIDVDNIEEAQLHKFYMFLLRKGFKGDDVAKILKVNRR